jgi:ribonuclease HI
MTKTNKVYIYSDGSIRENPGGCGGYAAVLVSGKSQRVVTGSEINTTNNRMELRAAISGLMTLNKPCEVIMVTDSKYLLNGMKKWITGWKKKKWKNSQGKPVANKDLWQMLDRLCHYHNVSWKWVKGHSGNKLNEVADELAGRAARKCAANEEA